jgi:hypothetical protein
MDRLKKEELIYFISTLLLPKLPSEPMVPELVYLVIPDIMYWRLD